MGELSMREQFYMEQLALLPLIAITQLHTYNEGIIQAITQQLDASFIDINGTNTPPTHSLDWTNQQAPGALDSWNNWILHSNEITRVLPFLDTAELDTASLPFSVPATSLSPSIE